ncbi:hypothetical protein HKX48_004177 [Thoreauomyces humboldtii]|nr:hypothetical protein HKX48_004177 [Thoreauomyces humboldtii]
MYPSPSIIPLPPRLQDEDYRKLLLEQPFLHSEEPTCASSSTSAAPGAFLKVPTLGNCERLPSPAMTFEATPSPRPSFPASSQSAAPPRATRSNETFFGHIGSADDAFVILDACRQGILRTVTGPPRAGRPARGKQREEVSPIRSGTIIVFDESNARIKRWRDGLKWTASRISGAFLTYTERDDGPIPRRTATSSIAARPSVSSFPSSRGSLTPARTSSASKRRLIKKTMAVTLDGTKYHVIGYYCNEDLATGNRLQTPTAWASAHNIRIDRAFWAAAHIAGGWNSKPPKKCSLDAKAAVPIQKMVTPARELPMSPPPQFPSLYVDPPRVQQTVPTLPIAINNPYGQQSHHQYSRGASFPSPPLSSSYPPVSPSSFGTESYWPEPSYSSPTPAPQPQFDMYPGPSSATVPFGMSSHTLLIPPAADVHDQYHQATFPHQHFQPQGQPAGFLGKDQREEADIMRLLGLGDGFEGTDWFSNALV